MLHSKMLKKPSYYMGSNLVSNTKINLDQSSKLIKFSVPALSLISNIQGLLKSRSLPAKNMSTFSLKESKFPYLLKIPEDPDCAMAIHCHNHSIMIQH